MVTEAQSKGHTLFIGRLIILGLLNTASPPASGQTDLGCIGNNGYRIMPDGQLVHSPMLCSFPETKNEHAPNLAEVKRLYIERLPEDLRSEVLQREKEKRGEPQKNWQQFLNQTGRNFAD